MNIPVDSTLVTSPTRPALSEIQQLIFDAIQPKHWMGTGIGHSVFSIPHTDFSDIAVRVPNTIIDVQGNTRTRPYAINQPKLVTYLLNSTSLTPVAPTTHAHRGEAMLRLESDDDHKDKITLIRKEPGTDLDQLLHKRLADNPGREAQVRTELMDEIYPHMKKLLEEVAEAGFYCDHMLDTATPRNFLYDPAHGIRLIDADVDIPVSNNPRERAEGVCAFALNAIIRSIDPSFPSRRQNDYKAMIAQKDTFIDALEARGTPINNNSFTQVNSTDAIAATSNLHALRSALDQMNAGQGINGR